jgi:hypothetical protein
MTTFLKGNFKDLGDGIWKTHPLQRIKATSISGALVKRFEDSWERPGVKRTVRYEVPDDPNTAAAGYEVTLELMLWRHVGADLTLLTAARGASEAARAGNPTGRLLYADGTFGAVSAEDVNDLVGFCFSEYYDMVQNRLVDDAAVTTVEAGDWFWVIRKGTFECVASETATIVIGDLLVTGLDTTSSEGGRLRDSNAMGTPNAAEITENTARKCVGMALATTSVENALFLAKVDVEKFGHEITDYVYQ